KPGRKFTQMRIASWIFGIRCNFSWRRSSRRNAPTSVSTWSRPRYLRNIVPRKTMRMRRRPSSRVRSNPQGFIVTKPKTFAVLCAQARLLKLRGFPVMSEWQNFSANGPGKEAGQDCLTRPLSGFGRVDVARRTPSILGSFAHVLKLFFEFLQFLVG